MRNKKGGLKRAYIGCSQIPLALRAELDCYSWKEYVVGGGYLDVRHFE